MPINQNKREKPHTSRHVLDVEKECQSLAKKLNTICEIRNVGMSELADRTGISRSTLYNILHGKSSPYIHTLLRICNVLEINITELFEFPGDTGDFYGSEMKESEKNLISNFRYLSKEKRKLLWIYLDMLMQYKGEFQASDDENGFWNDT